MTAPVAIIGAGMAGASAAATLRQAGRAVAVFDKGRGVGGRMATRRGPDGLTFDHGAQYFTARDPAFAEALASWRGTDAAAPWGEPGWSVGTPNMPEPVRALLAETPVTTSCTVSRLIREGSRWRLADAEGRPLADSFDAVLVTAPAPQALALLAATGAEWPEGATALGRVRYAPCWALMLVLAGEPPFDPPYLRGDEGAALAWIARDGTKPGRAAQPGNRTTLVAHAAPGWSRAHLECGRDEAAALLLSEVRHRLGEAAPEDGRIVHASAHRWRYALVEEPVGQPCLWSPGLRLGFAGDGFLGGRVEAAFLSGRALAERVLADGA